MIPGAQRRLQVRVAVERDEPRLRRALMELLEAGLQAAARRKLRERNPQAAEGLHAPDPTLDEGYYAWAAHLLRCERSGVPRHRLAASEALGLDVLELARAEFHREHPECPHCAALLLKAEDTLCWNCWEIIEKEDAA